VVGGGKKVRTAYGGPDGLVRDVCSALEKLGFNEDRGASAVLECQGSFKYQHDTDKDLKFVHVFPRVDTSKAEEAAAAAAAAAAGAVAAPPEQQALTLSLEALQKAVARRCGSLTQKQALLGVLKGASARFADAEARLARLEALPSELQAEYEAAVEVAEKISWLTGQLEAQSSNGPLTKVEQERVLSTADAKLKEAAVALAAAQADGKATRAASLTAAIERLGERRAAAAALTPTAGVAVKYEKQLKQISKQLADLEKIEACRGLQPLETVKKLREKPGLLETLQQIRDANRGWFEDEETFEKRMARAAKSAPAPAKPAATAGSAYSVPKGGAAQPRPAKGGVKSSNPWTALA